MKVTAGWCQRHENGQVSRRRTGVRKNCTGCYGRWHRYDGCVQERSPGYVDYRLVRCVACGRKATVFSGHVHRS
jgi:hypothetical protein